MADLSSYIETLKALDGGAFWTSLTEEQRKQLRGLAGRAVREGMNRPAFRAMIQERPLYKAYVRTTGAPTEPPPPDEEPTPTPDPEPEDDETPAPAGPDNDDARALIRAFLSSWGLGNLDWFVEKALGEGWGPGSSEFQIRLRETEEYKQAFPEQALRQQNGFTFLPEEQILAERNEIRRLTREYLGIEPEADLIARVIGKDRSPAEWESTVRTWKEFQRWGPTVRSVLEQELGYQISDDRAFAFLSQEIPTPELDRAYQRAMMRGQPALLGLGIRPEDEATLLERYGIDVASAFRGYQGIAAELPRAERYGLIEAEISKNTERFPGATDLFADTPFATLFRAIQLQDPDAIMSLQQQMAREVARFQGQGGAATTGAGSVGLLSEEERNRL